MERSGKNDNKDFNRRRLNNNKRDICRFRPVVSQLSNHMLFTTRKIKEQKKKKIRLKEGRKKEKKNGWILRLRIKPCP